MPNFVGICHFIYFFKLSFVKNTHKSKQKFVKICYIVFTENKCKFYPYPEICNKKLTYRKKKAIFLMLNTLYNCVEVR